MVFQSKIENLILKMYLGNSQLIKIYNTSWSTSRGYLDFMIKVKFVELDEIGLSIPGDKGLHVIKCNSRNFYQCWETINSFY